MARIKISNKLHHYTPMQTGKMTRENLEKAYAVIVRHNNKALERLEKGSKAKKYKHIDYTSASNSYRWAKEQADKRMDFMTKDGSKPRFTTDTKKMDTEHLRRAVNEAMKFHFEAKTSTITGTNKTIMGRKKSLESSKKLSTKARKMFKSMSLEDFSEFWERGVMKRLMQVYGSDEIIEIIVSAKLDLNDSDTLDYLENLAEEAETTGEMRSENEIMNELGGSIEDLFKQKKQGRKKYTKDDFMKLDF